MKLDQLWRPPRMYIAELYANSLKTVALGLVYGPIYPVSYLWSSFAMFFCYACSRYALSRPACLCASASAYATRVEVCT